MKFTIQLFGNFQIHRRLQNIPKLKFPETIKIFIFKFYININHIYEIFTKIVFKKHRKLTY